MEILASEKKYRLLLDLSKQSYYAILYYAKLLAPHHPTEVFSTIQIYIIEHATKANTRKDYKKVCHSIKLLFEIGGKAESKFIIARFKNEYIRRPSMQDEIHSLEKQLSL